MAGDTTSRTSADSPPEKTVRILHLEDSQADAELIQEMLTEDGLKFETIHVDNREDFLAALREGGFDLILADYSLPSFDGITAMNLARDACPDVPFILVSAILGEEVAIETVKQGATDYVLKQRLSRLGPSVRRALRESEDRKERMRAEEALRDKENQLRQAQKLEALGRLAGGIAHDFNNLLTIIMGYSRSLLNELGPDHRLATQIRETQKAGARAAMLIKQLLAFGRRQVLDPRVLDLNFVIDSLQGMLGPLMGGNIQLTIRKDPSLAPIKADQGQIEQVIMNLVVNARDAMPQGGTLTIETATVDVPLEDRPEGPYREPGRYATLAVRDTGSGMDAETQAKIFEPFFSTKEEGKGSGLGLAMVHGIITQSKGWVSVDSAPRLGTVFTLYLPETDEPAPSLQPKPRLEKPLSGAETILLVEDEGAVRMQIRDGLQQLGYAVLEAPNAVRALQVSNQLGKPIDLLLADVVLPGMSGWDLAQQLTSIQPNMKVLYISGYIDDMEVVHGMSSTNAAFLQKPFTPETIAEKVRDLLGG